MIKKHLCSSYNFKKFVGTIKHNYKKQDFKNLLKTQNIIIKNLLKIC